MADQNTTNDAAAQQAAAAEQAEAEKAAAEQAEAEQAEAEQAEAEKAAAEQQAPAETTDRTFIARTSAFVDHDGGSVRIKKGITRVREGHPLLQRYPDLFEKAGSSVHFDTVETTRDAPSAPPATAKKTAGKSPRSGRRGGN